MNLQEFIEKYDGKFVEVAGSPGAENQCVDLANAYLKEVLNHPIVEWTNATDFPGKLSDFKWVENTVDAIPQPGNIIIWQHNKYGHIAICVDASQKFFHSFDQNFPINSPAHIQYHNYENPKVAGWLVPGKESMPSELEVCMIDRAKFWKERDEALAKVELLEIDKKDLEEKARILEFDKNKLSEQLKDCQIKLENGDVTGSVEIKETEYTIKDDGNKQKWEIDGLRADSKGLRMGNYRKV